MPQKNLETTVGRYHNFRKHPSNKILWYIITINILLMSTEILMGLQIGELSFDDEKVFLYFINFS